MDSSNAGFTPEQMSAIIKRLTEMASDVCPKCRKNRMLVLPGITLLPITSTHNLVFANPSGIIPCIAVMCADCGSMQFFNVHVLGLARELGVPAPETPIGATSSSEKSEKVEESNG